MVYFQLHLSGIQIYVKFQIRTECVYRTIHLKRKDLRWSLNQSFVLLRNIYVVCWKPEFYNSTRLNVNQHTLSNTEHLYRS